MSKPDVKYEDLLKMEYELNRIKDLGIETYRVKNMLKIVVGVGCVIIAVIPNGLGIIFYPLGLSLLISGGIDLVAFSKTVRQRLKFKLWSMKR